MRLEFLPYVEIDGRGQKTSADVYPFVNGKPAKQLASCGMCQLYKEDAEYCDGWVDDKANAPMFCGPICTKFTPTNEAEEIIAALEIES